MLLNVCKTSIKAHMPLDKINCIQVCRSHIFKDKTFKITCDGVDIYLWAIFYR